MIGARPSLLVVSPMRRAAYTGLAAFHDAAAVVARDEVHERSGLYVWDRRRPLAALRADERMARGGVEWGGVASEECPWWNEEAREGVPSMVGRLVAFMRWLRERPEREVAVASHSSIMYCLLQSGLLALPAGATTANGMAADAWFLTGELRSFTLRWAPDADGGEELKS